MKQTVQPAEGNPQRTQIEASRDAQVVTCVLDNSWSTLTIEVALIDRLFGGDIAALFERHGDDDERHIRG